MYDLDEHRHRFASWAAARAAQRGWLNSTELINALELSGLPRFVAERGREPISRDDFDENHRVWATSLLDALDLATTDGLYGRAAKLIAIYLKGTVVLGPLGDSPLARISHPPVDRVLLQALSKDAKVPPHLRKLFRTATWTKFGHSEYERVIAALRTLLGPDEPFWAIERYWTPQRE